MTDDIFAGETDPYDLFTRWFQAAHKAEGLAEAVTLATVDADGMPNARMVLAKGMGPNGFHFYTHATSAKGLELAHTPKAALVFYWKSMNRQIRVRGAVAPLGADASDAYFASRPRDSQIGAWASIQSTALEGRATLEQRVKDFTTKFTGKDVPRPEQWIGYRLDPVEIEFWQDQPNRLHDRLQFRRANPTEDQWTITRLYP